MDWWCWFKPPGSKMAWLYMVCLYNRQFLNFSQAIIMGQTLWLLVPQMPPLLCCLLIWILIWLFGCVWGRSILLFCLSPFFWWFLCCKEEPCFLSVVFCSETALPLNYLSPESWQTKRAAKLYAWALPFGHNGNYESSAN